MRKLTVDKLEAARRFIKTSAQDIDAALFEHYFEGRSQEQVAAVLGSYQNPDGGFGMLDYDIENPCSCLKHSESALKLVTWIDSPDHPYYQMYRPYVEQNLDAIVDAQQADGTWLPDWRWGKLEVSERVQRRLKGLLTVQFLWALHKFGRLELGVLGEYRFT
jgi:hypothetical protein